MLAFFNRNQGEDWELIGPGDYVNPLIIDVLPSLLVADKYEQNDAPGEAYPLTLTYAGNVGRATTAGSNIHASGNDDYYRIDLPAGREYDISAALHDSWTDEAGGFTNDVSVMVNPGDGWSDVYDDSTDVIHVTGGRSVIFKVQSLYLGTLGTYQLDVRAARSTSGVDEPAAPTKLDLTVYPLPASSELHVRLDSRFGRLLRLHLVDAVGRTVAERAVDEKDVFDFKLDGVASGAYMLVAETGHGEVVRRVVVRR